MNFWPSVEQAMLKYGGEAIDFTVDKVIWNTICTPVNHIKNFLCLVAKYYIYIQRCLNKSLNITEYIKLIQQHENIEKFYAIKNRNIDKHYKKWFSSKKLSQNQQQTIDNFVQQYLIQM